MTTTLELRQPMTRAELVAIGIPDWQISELVADGTLRRVLRGVYVGADLPDSPTLRAACAARVIAPHHVAVDRTAAWLHGVDVLAYAEHDPLPPIETRALRGHQPTARSSVQSGERDLVPRDIATVHGIRTTTPLRTAMDLGCHLRRREAMAALNEFARRHGITLAMMRQELPRFRRRRGVVQLKELVPHIEPKVESQRESWTLLAIIDAGLPRPEAQVWVYVDGVPTYRLDFAYPKRRVCVEYDGAEAHEQTSEQKEYDEARRAWLRDHGWTVIVVRAGDFTDMALERWLQELRDALDGRYTTRRW